MLTEDECLLLESILESPYQNHPKVSERERNFVNDQKERYQKYGQETRMSDKQWKWLKSIYERATDAS